MPTVTISREYGSAGTAVAREAAGLLGYHFVDKAAIGRILAGYGLIDFERTYDTETGIWSTFDTRVRTIVAMLERITFAVARHGHSVILGRGSYAVLKGAPGVLNVRIRAPFDWRVSRSMAEDGVSDRAKAEAEVREGDKIRASFVTTIYGLRWDSIEGFDLVVDTSRIAPSRAAGWIVEAVRAFRAVDPLSVPGADSRLALADPTLDEAVASELNCTGKHRTG